MGECQRPINGWITASTFLFRLRAGGGSIPYVHLIFFLWFPPMSWQCRPLTLTLSHSYTHSLSLYLSLVFSLFSLCICIFVCAWLCRLSVVCVCVCVLRSRPSEPCSFYGFASPPAIITQPPASQSTEQYHATRFYYRLMYFSLRMLQNCFGLSGRRADGPDSNHEGSATSMLRQAV